MKKVDINKNQARNALFDWAFVNNYSEVLKYLAEEKAWKETWSFSSEPIGRYSILDSYLRYTFYRIRREKKDVYSKDGELAIFNTGLVDKTYLPIYALFDMNKIINKQPWHFCAFITEGEKWGSYPNRYSSADFDETPKRAQYFDNPSDFIYIVSETSDELSIRFEHILDEEHIGRIPTKLFEDLFPGYTGNPREVLNDSSKIRKLQDRFKSAIELSRKKILWNYKTAIPMYFPQNNNISLLLPLCLVNDQIVDLALVVSRKSSRYLAETIYPLDWAYKCARLICRPDSDWLKPSSIVNDGNEYDD